jgi:hypothetical protein
MGFLKAVVKLSIILVLAAAMAGVVVLVKRPKNADPVTYDEWPPVAQNPAA